jgi:O-antigen/teichoic acid export membrane protein
MLLARVPLFMFTSLQASLLPGLAGAIAAGDRPRFRRLLARGCVIVTILGLGGALPGVIAGPWLARVLFAARPALGRADFALLAAGTLCYMLAMVLGQGAMALSRHRDQLLAWLAGAVVLTVITLGPGAARLRVEAAYAVSSLAVACALALVLFLRTRRPVLRTRRPGPAGQIQSLWRGQASRVSTTSGGPPAARSAGTVKRPR